MIVEIPNTHAISVLILTCVALYLFSRDHIPLQTSSLLVLVLLTVGFELFPFYGEHGQLHAIDFFSGFGHEALIAVCGLMITGYGMVRTGALEPVGRVLSKMWTKRPSISLLFTLLIGALLSAFVNNTPIVVLLLPILVSVSLRTQTAASSILMPMGFATLVGGMGTTIGTSTNLLVVSVAADLGLRRFGMFDFFVPAVIAASIGILYLWLIAPRLIPERRPVLSDTSPRVFSAQLLIPEGSYSDGKTLIEVLAKTDGRMHVTKIQRGVDQFIVTFPDAIIKTGDRLLVDDSPNNLKEYEQLLGAQLYSGDFVVDDEHPLQNTEQQLAEIVVTQESPLVGTTLNDLWFADSYRLATLAIHRAGREITRITKSISDITIRVGDIILVQGHRDQIREIKQSGSFLILDATTDLPHSEKAWLSMFIMVGVITLAATGVLPIAISAVLGALLMIVTRCLEWRDVGRAVNTQVILIVVASLALGSALLKTGATDYLAQQFLVGFGEFSPAFILSSLILMMAIFTNIVSNNAAAVIGTPIAMSIAHSLNLPAEPFVLAVLFGSNMSYATPMAYKTNLLVMTAGGYTFSDFLRVGIPLTIIMWLTLSWLLPVMYGL